MALDEKSTRQKLTALWKSKGVKELSTAGKKYVMFSDFHLGDDTRADDFRKNKGAFQRALDYYKKEGFTLIFLGDMEELWQFDLETIKEKYQKAIYNKIRAFGDNRVIRIFGNHDIEWGVPDDPMKNNDDSKSSKSTHEAIKLKDKTGKARIIMVHGHQGSKESDKTSWFSRFFVRLYKPFERVIDLDTHSSATKSQVTTEYEEILSKWAESQKLILICGHSHRAIFATKSHWRKLLEEEGKIQKEILKNRDNKNKVKGLMKDLRKVFEKRLNEESKNRKIGPTSADFAPKPCYFNTGCGLYSDGITGIELSSDELRLVKWHRKDKGNKNRIILDGCCGKLSDFVKEIDS